MKILVVRRDNIGDLVCTTPLIQALHSHFPTGRIDALVNSYNAPVLYNNPDLQNVFVYTKAKHRAVGQSVIQVYWDRIKLIRELRRIKYDYAILASAGFSPRPLRFAKLVAPRHIIGFTAADTSDKKLDTPVPYGLPGSLHEVEDIFRLLTVLGVEGEPPAMKIIPQDRYVEQVDEMLRNAGIDRDQPVVGVHISARKPSNRWPVAKFSEMIQVLHERHRSPMLLFWSPGSENNRLHPGDDEKAQQIIQACNNIPLISQPTHRLEQLIAGLARCQTVVCSDGGAMHIAAAVGCSIVCFFGNSDRTRWYPWKAPHVLIQPVTKSVADIPVAEVCQAVAHLYAK